MKKYFSLFAVTLLLGTNSSCCLKGPSYPLSCRLAIYCDEWCGTPPPTPTSRSMIEEAHSYGPPGHVSYQVSSNDIGADAEHTLVFDTNLGDLKTLEAVITYPKEFTFNGFLSLGPVNSVVGTMSADVDFTGGPEVTASVLSSDDFSAYPDLNGNGVHDYTLEPSIFVSQDRNGNRVLRVDALPDQSPADLVSNVALRMIYVMNAGVMTNPTVAGVWTVTGQFISIDPDTGGGNNGSGEAPQTLNLSEEIVIEDPDTSFHVRDAIQVLQICAGIVVEDELAVTDISGDNRIGMQEAVYVLQSISEQR